METRIDRSRYSEIDLLCKKTKYHRHLYFYMGEEDAVLDYLESLIPENAGMIPVHVERLYNRMRKECREEDECTYSVCGERLQFYQMYWGKVCIYAYFYFHDDAMWQQMIMPELLKRVATAELRDDIETAQFKIDQHLGSCACIQAMPPHAPAPALPTPAVTDFTITEADLEHTFSLRYRRTEDYKHLLQFLETERTEASNSDWARYGLALFRANIFANRPTTFKAWFPRYCELFGREVAFQMPNKLDRTACKKNIQVFLPNW